MNFNLGRKRGRPKKGQGKKPEEPASTRETTKPTEAKSKLPEKGMSSKYVANKFIIERSEWFKQLFINIHLWSKKLLMIVSMYFFNGWRPTQDIDYCISEFLDKDGVRYCWSLHTFFFRSGLSKKFLIVIILCVSLGQDGDRNYWLLGFSSSPVAWCDYHKQDRSVWSFTSWR